MGRSEVRVSDQVNAWIDKLEDLTSKDLEDVFQACWLIMEARREVCRVLGCSTFDEET